MPVNTRTGCDSAVQPSQSFRITVLTSQSRIGTESPV